MNDDDLVAKGFHRLDPKLLPTHPPKINWGKLYEDKTDAEKIIYLEKLAATMNHAAYLIQTERNELGELCERKEAQIESMKQSLDQNNEMIQGTITQQNAERQQYNAAIVELKSKIKVLENAAVD
jgi:uncharacterized protein YydD (DUF2326 family)